MTAVWPSKTRPVQSAISAIALGVSVLTLAAGQAAAEPVVIRAALVFDGETVHEGHDVEVDGGRIVAIRPSTGGADIDLGARMLAPGLIDTHVHLTWYFTGAGKLNRPGDGEDGRSASLNAAGNAWRMLQAGFTTIQSVGAPEDAFVRDAITAGAMPGPRILTSLGQIYLRDVGSSEAAMNAALDARDSVRATHDAGADLIKIMALDRIRPAAVQMQLDAACSEARSLGLRSVVHANTAEIIKAAVRAGCTQVDHGAYADAEAIAMMAANGTYYEPQCNLVILNYFYNWPRFEGPDWDDARKENLERLLVGFREVAKRWLAEESLKVVYGSDAVAGAHGLNGADLVCRTLDLGQPVLDALRSATRISAESVGLGDRIGALAPGYDADLIAFDGDPRAEPETLMAVAFVMREGVIYRSPPDRAGPGRLFP